MKNKAIYLILAFILLIAPAVNAGLFNSRDIVLSLNQTDYYFKTGENAIIHLYSDNTYGEPVNGMLTYSITQSINQGGFQYSSSNTQSTSFTIPKDKADIPINFGSSNSPEVLQVNLKFLYNENSQSREVNLDGLKIHFVSDTSQQPTNQKSISSSSQQTKSSSQSSSQQNNNFFSQQQKKIQNEINQMNQMNSPQQTQQNSQQALQNNQMNQDSSALKHQMENQLAQQQQMKQDFQKSLVQNREFQREHQKLLNQGYKLTNASLNPSSKNTGNFKLDYQNKNGEHASLKGQMQDGKMQNLQEDTPEVRQQILKKLEQNQKFQKYQNQLQKQGFKQSNMNFSQIQNKTDVQINYTNPEDNESKVIQAQIINGTVQNVKLEQAKKNRKFFLWLLLFLPLIAVIYLLYKRLNKKKEIEEVIIEEKIEEKPFDYKAESMKLIKKAKELFEQEKYKDSYGTAGQALRMFLSYKNKLNKEMTNDEIIEYLRKHKKPYEKAKHCFDLCSLVEFAKYKTNKKDFEKIIRYATNIIKGQS